MKNIIKLIVITVLIMAAAIPAFARGSSDKASTAPATKAGSGQGGFSITGLEKYNGMIISAEDGRLIKTNDGIIANGSVTLNVTSSDWNDDIDGFQTVPYTGTNTLILGFTIADRNDPSKIKAEYYYVPVEFDNGVAQITYAEISNPASNNWQ